MPTTPFFMRLYMLKLSLNTKNASGQLQKFSDFQHTQIFTKLQEALTPARHGRL